MKKIYFKSLLLMVIVLGGCSGNGHFITDSKYRKLVSKQFEDRRALAHNREKQLFAVFNNNLDTRQKEALEFLYAFMPLSDLADYDGEYYLDQVNLSFAAKDTFSWGKEIPEQIFRHFVLPIRVNNENLDTSRAVFFRELKSRIKGMSIEEAALEVNHWCHEKVNYRPSDGRTSSPLATMKTSFGRCGEESTFTVAAMRAVAIPARQVYTPRWAHSDDNHAWVEVFVNGKWQYLGACEPEAVLNKGWFDAPVKRAMMVHTNVMGIYNDENVIDQTTLSTKINSLPSYTVTKKLTILVKGNDNQPVEGAKILFGLYNYSEFYPIVTKKSDKNGAAEILTGLGDLQVWVSKDSLYGYSRVSVGLTDTAVIKLDNKPGKEYLEVTDNIPPVQKVVEPVSSDKEEINKKRLSQEDSIRNAYMATFMPTADAEALALNNKLDTAKIKRLIALSYGNWENISGFISQYAGQPYAIELLESLSEKDLRDISKESLEDHLLNTKTDTNVIINAGQPAENSSNALNNAGLFYNSILSPRISNEMIRPWRGYLVNAFSDILNGRDNLTDRIIKWINDSILITDKENYMNCPLSPVGVYELKVADKHSRNIFFVALCRSFSIPSRIDQATLLPQVFINGDWQNISFEVDKKIERTAHLTLLDGDNPVKPEYYIHYTIQKFTDGSFRTLDYEGDELVSEFPVNLTLEPGYYLLMTGHRKEDGSVVVRSEYFNLKKGDNISKTVILEPFNEEKKVEGIVDLNFQYNGSVNNTLKSIAGEKGIVVSIIDPGGEPSRHLLNDLAPLKNDFNNWGGYFLFAVESETSLSNINKNELPDNLSLQVDKDQRLLQTIASAAKRSKNTQLPLVVFINHEGEITFLTNGYHIGTGENLLRAMK
ncbi:MAG TPA: transglutaminase-like domain-containing protein [Lentimicrobium sp.]|nr:transglutaminase-like domain-containing protein [Lentimicrobium sp.]